MSDSELTHALQVLKRLCAEDEINDVELSKLFGACVQLRDLIEDTCLASNDSEYQEATHMCIKALEKCTFMVNELELFSTNETAEDLQTESIRYLTLPALLGSLNLTVQTTDLSERMTYVEKAEVYFRDFLHRCSNYGLCEISRKFFKEVLKSESEKNSDPSSIRERKLQQFKRKKELEIKEKTLKPALEKPESEEYFREYYFVLLEKWILITVDELENVKREKDILKRFPKQENVPKSNMQDKKSEVKPLKPFIITKNAIQKEVFGLGYPSIPVMTIDDFYRQKFEKVVEEQKQSRKGQSLQDAALSGAGMSKEAEDIAKEELLDKDDMVTLLKERQWDDWKDDNPRGSGNRKNKG